MFRVNPPRCLAIVTILCIVVSSTGCRNRNLWGPCAPGCSPFSGPTTINSPGTYSLNIPGSNNSNANGLLGAGQRPLQQATNTLPVPNGVNVQNGWQPIGAGNGAANSNQSTNNTAAGLNGNQTTSVLENNSQTNQTAVVSVTPPNRFASNTGQNGLSFTNDTNFRTTAIDERQDQSRLPVTDASQVRAPTQFNPTTTRGQFNSPYYVPNQTPVQNVQPQYQNIPGYSPYGQNPNPQRSNTNPNLVRGGTVYGQFGMPTFGQPAPQNYTGTAGRNQVVAQSTVFADPANDPNFQDNWRGRDLTASRDSFNR
ncbi:MAG: hypothetical protein AAGA30_09380 [Planctomycetota bacterium]